MAALITGKINENMVAEVTHHSVSGFPNNANKQVTIPDQQTKHSLSDLKMAKNQEREKRMCKRKRK